MKEIYYTWEEFNQDIFLLVNQIYLSDWIPDYIAGVKRGGLVPAVKLSHILNKPLTIISCQLRDDNSSLFFFEDLPKNKKILVVDDICDNGDTFKKISQELNEYKELKFCSLYHNIRQSFLSDYKARKIDREKDNRWVIFPWEV
jgi:hypoxanthine phosphoribosyltransferase